MEAAVDMVCAKVSLRTSWFILLLLQASSVATQICQAPLQVEFPENNNVGDLVMTITVQDGVELLIADSSLPFRTEGNQLLASEVLDYEEKSSYTVSVTCNGADLGSRTITIVVLLMNLNDNKPVFGQAQYQTTVHEMSAIDTSVDRFPATDLDGPLLYYWLTSESNAFKLRSATSPEILVNTVLDYDKVKEFKLILQVQDTPLDPPEAVSNTATTTVLVSVLDVDNRPPWFQPCSRLEVGGTVICDSAGYSGNINLNEQVPGPLPLLPGPLHAIDGDVGIDEDITYSVVRGNEDGLFEINPNTGNITMVKPADVLGPINLVVLAAQKINSHQFATTTITIGVRVDSLHAPQFQKTTYEAVITSVGSWAEEKQTPAKTKNFLLITATDEDYAGNGGLNPHITYSLNRDEFSIFGGYLVMTEELSEMSLTLQVVAKDTVTDETATATILVEIKPVEEIPPPAGGVPVAATAALGATLGILLLVSLIVIGVLVHRTKKGNAAWKKIQEASMFKSSLSDGSGGQKQAIQYTNDGFQDDSGGSIGSGHESGQTKAPIGGSPVPAVNPYDNKATGSTLESGANLQPESSSDNGSEKADDELEVKPILTKERRVEEGYKSVWFKEDIDPSAKEEVVIIPDNREDESEEDEEEGEDASPQEEEADETGRHPDKSSKVSFADTDLDSGLGVKMGDPAEDSDSDGDLDVDL